ncbi:MAG: M1 family aminopeptidase [Candidatus Cloacimonadaceae bacterium]|nr:T9SS type A sorting domain-containing protein [Candidatus Cloacimonadota bacterium]MDX9948870.1 M1 family aminopeptidase [Candidatus Syntrophosphaera sp.]NLN85057.1 T9SS type A sorting domain-containing protein [Candidatus Cloacimonadota bacterium]
MKRSLSIIMLLVIAASAFSAIAPQRKPFRPGFSSGSQNRAELYTGFDVLHYDITISIDQTARQIEGNVVATVLAQENLDSIPYNLVGLDVSSVLLNGAPATYTHAAGIIDINVDIPAGQTFTTQVFYQGTPILSGSPYNVGMIFSSNTVFTISDPDAARYWWPCYDHPWDKATVNLNVTLREDWKVASNGTRQSITNNGDGTATTVWHSADPMTTYLVCVTCGPYVEFTQHAPIQGVPIQNFVMQNQYNNAQIDLARMPLMIDYFSELFGPYPFEKYGNSVVNMSTFGAMEHQTMTTLGSYIINGSGTHELTVAHELAHQWFGNAVSFLDFNDVWLSEAFATYSEHIWVDKTEGWQAACDYVSSSYHQYYLSWENSAGPQIIHDPAFNSYFAPPSYEKAASVLHMLRLKLGNDAFFQLLQEWFAENNGGNVVTAEFQAKAEQVSGQNLTQFFDQWIFSAGIPAFEYSIWTHDEAAQPLRIFAKTTSNTTTPFHIEVPFRLQNGAQSDSLLVFADPDGVDNFFNATISPAAIFSANHNNWALLRSHTELKPVISECLPSNGSVLLSWERFQDNPNLRYNVYRFGATMGGDWELLNSEPLDELSFTDTSMENGQSWFYAISAVDPDGWVSTRSEPMEATPVGFTFAENLLVVDETRDGNGANINPDDAMVDSFYAAALSPIQYQDWDVASQGLPPLDVLGNHKVVFWHADDFSQNLLIDHQNVLGGYLIGGGKLILSGWKTPSVLSDIFLSRFAGNVELIYDNSPSLISAQSAQYPELEVDPDKVLSIWNGMLPYIYTFSGAQQPIYTAVMSPTAQGNGNCAALRMLNPDSGMDFILLGFPLYFMKPDGVRGFLQSAVTEMLNNTSTQDVATPPLTSSLDVFPNPFSSSIQIQAKTISPGTLELSVYNLKGQKIRTLCSDTKNAGSHSFSFDAKDFSGKELSSGIYLVRMISGDKVLSKKISLIKGN